MEEARQPPSYETLVLVGFIHSSNQYVAHWTDTYGGKFSAIGKGTRNGNSIESRFEYDDGPFFNTFTWNPLLRQWTFRMESQADGGARRLFATDTPVRRE